MKYHLKEEVKGLWIDKIVRLIFTNLLKIGNNRTIISNYKFCFDNDLFVETTSKKLYLCLSVFVHNLVFWTWNVQKSTQSAPFHDCWTMAHICYDNLWHSQF